MSSDPALCACNINIFNVRNNICSIFCHIKMNNTHLYIYNLFNILKIRQKMFDMTLFVCQRLIKVVLEFILVKLFMSRCCTSVFCIEIISPAKVTVTPRPKQMLKHINAQGHKHKELCSFCNWEPWETEGRLQWEDQKPDLSCRVYTWGSSSGVSQLITLTFRFILSQTQDLRAMMWKCCT